MASAVHCLYCFESLAAYLEKRKSVSLDDIQASWADYAQTLEKETASAAPESSSSKQLPALRRLAEDAATGSGSSSSGSSSSSASASSVSLALGDEATTTTPATSVTSLTTITSATAEFPLFVTWNTLARSTSSSSSRRERSPERSLRGCIGTFEALELDDGLSSYAITSAVHDSRFDPVRIAELPELEVAVTLLTDFEDAADASDWILGVHGLRISFTHHGRRYGATYLPDVAPEQGWTRDETVVSLMRKAGWMGRKERWRDVELKVVRYQGKRESLEYAEYRRWRDWWTANQK
jgi:uncharacterized protein (TIGR00296 family)